MQKVPQKYRQAKIDELTPHPRNPNQGDVGAIRVGLGAGGPTLDARRWAMPRLWDATKRHSSGP